MRYKALFVPLKDILIFIAWIGVIVLIGGLSWYLTRSLRADFLKNSINQALINMEDSRRLEAPIIPGNRRIFVFSSGYWFSLAGEEDNFLFFTLIADGTFLPCAAIMSPDGKVKEIISLSSRGERILSHVSPGIIRLYIRRIEGET